MVIPKGIPFLFIGFRIMVFLSAWFFMLFFLCTYMVYKRKTSISRPLLRLALWSIPLPLIAIECGWYVAEHGRQPWAIDHVLPTFLSVSSISPAEIWFTLIGITLLYTIFLIIEIYLMFKYARLGPSSLKTGRYHLEKSHSKEV